ncbi:SRPBCC family protein [Mesorhizobium marinum]|uniref:SRPBCC family protein n=1 Tax=Mesorhizobium marinum TaxID=3228790 RepID=UPI003467AB61
MRSPQGEDHWLGGTYIEIVRDLKIVFSHAWQDASGQAGPETTVTVRLADSDGGGTLLTLHQAFFVTVSSRDGHMEGWNETLDQLERHLAT